MSSFFLSTTIIILCGCATTLPDINSGNKCSLKELCLKYNVLIKRYDQSGMILLCYGDSHAQLFINADFAVLAGNRVALSSPVILDGGEIRVPFDVESKILIPLLSHRRPTTKIFRLKNIHKVVIDPGHGGGDPGTIGVTGVKEKDIVFDIAKRLKKILVKKGIEVVMTRDRDKFVSLQHRTEIANTARADLFISIHANSQKSGNGGCGVEIFCLRDIDSPFNGDSSSARHARAVMFGRLSMDRQDVHVKEIVTDMLHVRKKSVSQRVAEDMICNLLKIVKVKNRGVKYADFYVLKNTLVPAVLVEVGFLSNPEEERLLRTRSYRQKIAYALAESILGYINKQ